MNNSKPKKIKSSTSFFFDDNFDIFYEMSESILKSTSINRLFYSICKFFCSYFSCDDAQGFVCISDEFYLISEFKTSVNQFSIIDYIPCQVVNPELNAAKDYIINTFKTSKRHLNGNSDFLNDFPSFNQKTLIPLFCDNYFYGFILLNGNQSILNTNGIASKYSNLVNLQSSACIKHLCNNNINLYFSLPLNVCHPIFKTKLNEMERFTCLISIDGTILNSSNGSIDVLKYSSLDLINSSIYSYIHPCYKNRFAFQCKNLLKTKNTYTNNILMRNKLKTYSLVKYTLKCSYDEFDNINGIFMIISKLDYSDTQIQKELNPMKTKNIVYNRNNIFSSTTNGIFVLRNKKLIYVNEIGLGYFGLNTNISYTNKSIDYFFTPVSLNHIKLSASPSFTSLIEEKYNEKTFNLDITVMRTSDKTTLDFTLNLSPISKDLSKDSIIVLTKCTSLNNDSDRLRKDIETKNELLNSALKSEKMRCDFFANISHDLRTPVSVIYSALQLLDMELPKYIPNIESTPIIKRTKTIKQNCYRLIKLVNNIVDSSKIESGYLQISLGKFNIISLVENITNSVAEYIENKHINLIFDTNIEEKMIFCDPEKIERVILNLISNAIKFTPQNGYIYVNMEDKLSYIVISVRDTGLGIPVEKLDTIFGRFTQVNSTRTEEKQGSGIGLSLVKSLVEMHKGEVWAESREGVGATFFVKLPYFENPELLNPNAILKTKLIQKDKIQNIEIEFSDIY